MVGHDDADRCGRGVRAACEAAAFVHSNDVQAACSRIRNRLRELNVTGYRVERLVRIAETCRAAIEQTDTDAQGLPTVRDILPDAPVHNDAVVPSGWSVSIDGVQREDAADPDQSIPAVVVVCGRSLHINGREEYFDIAWRRNGEWTRHVVPRRQVANSRLAVDLSNLGMPITSNNAASLVQFVLDFETANLHLLPVSRHTHQLGWQGPDGEQGFLWGRDLLGDNAARPFLGGERVTPTASITFRGPDEGDEQLADGFVRQGTLGGWLEAIHSVRAFPRVRLAFYTSFATVLLTVLRSFNFLVSLAGPTSCGKTVTLRVAASVWGNPDERSPGSILSTWDATRTWVERAAAIRNGLPLILDDTKRCRRRTDISQTIYDTAAGRGRGRGSLSGTRHSDTFATILLTSGEEPATAFTNDGGTRARVIEIWGSPFGATGVELADIVTDLNTRVLSHFGHAGPLFVRYVCEHRGDWNAWRQAFQARCRHFEQRGGANPVAHRMASHLALLDFTAEHVHRAIALPWEYGNLIDSMWDETTSETQEADRAEAALRRVVSWAYANRGQFYGQAGFGPNSPREYVGRWDNNRQPAAESDRHLGILPHKLDEILLEGGFEPSAIRRMWFDRGWLRHNAGRRTLRVRMGEGSGTSVVAISWIAIEALERFEAEPEPGLSWSNPRVVGA